MHLAQKLDLVDTHPPGGERSRKLGQVAQRTCSLHAGAGTATMETADVADHHAGREVPVGVVQRPPIDGVEHGGLHGREPPCQHLALLEQVPHPVGIECIEIDRLELVERPFCGSNRGVDRLALGPARKNPCFTRNPMFHGTPVFSRNPMFWMNLSRPIHDISVRRGCDTLGRTRSHPPRPANTASHRLLPPHRPEPRAR